MDTTMGAEGKMMNRWWGFAGVIGPIIAGRVFDIFGNYTNAFYVGSGICILALGSLLLAKRRHAARAMRQLRY